MEKGIANIFEKINKEIHVPHPYQGTRKGNKIENKIFCFISQILRGTPLTDLTTSVNRSGDTKTIKGLYINAQPDTNIYQLLPGFSR